MRKEKKDNKPSELKERKPKPHESLSEFLLNSPLRGANLKLKRNKDLPRKIDLE